jgi:hypothetical protein
MKKKRPNLNQNENDDLKKEILNSDEKLDKILKDEWGLEKE